jgi:hypothetical protein
MNQKELTDFFTGKDEVEITDELISKLKKEQNLNDEDAEFMQEMAQQGAKWNIKRNSLILPF